MQIRRADQRGHANWGWLDTHHTFSFANYYDPAHMGFRALRVINEDRVEPGAGFGTHGHRDMEIITYVLDGALEHRDSMGNTSVIRPGEVQRMTAGTGVTHSEYNHSDVEPVHFLQIWLLPNERGLRPGYEQIAVPAPTDGALVLIASPDGAGGSVTVHQDVRLYAARLARGERVDHQVAAGRHAWIQVTRGTIELGGEGLGAGDGVAIDEPGALTITATDDAELLVFDLA